MHDKAFTTLIHGLDQLDSSKIEEPFVAHNEFVQLSDFLPENLTLSLVRELDTLKDSVHRSYIRGT